MGVLTVLGLQLCLLAFSLGAQDLTEWSDSDTESHLELNSREMPPNFETGYGALHQAEAPELGLEMKYQTSHDYDMLMKHRVRRSEKRKKKQKTKDQRPGTFSPLGSTQPTFLDGKRMPGSSRTKREAEAEKKRRFLQRQLQGKMSPIGSTGDYEVVRTKRQLENSRKSTKKPKQNKNKPRKDRKQGERSLIGSQLPADSNTEE